jgi:hypothetical protein
MYKYIFKFYKTSYFKEELRRSMVLSIPLQQEIPGRNIAEACAQLQQLCLFLTMQHSIFKSVKKGKYI